MNVFVFRIYSNRPSVDETLQRIYELIDLILKSGLDFQIRQMKIAGELIASQYPFQRG